jgi:hypothetical protein
MPEKNRVVLPTTSTRIPVNANWHCIMGHSEGGEWDEDVYIDVFGELTPENIMEELVKLGTLLTRTDDGSISYEHRPSCGMCLSTSDLWLWTVCPPKVTWREKEFREKN